MIPLSSIQGNRIIYQVRNFEISAHYPFLTTARSDFGEPREKLLTYGRDNFNFFPYVHF